MWNRIYRVALLVPLLSLVATLDRPVVAQEMDPHYTAISYQRLVRTSVSQLLRPADVAPEIGALEGPDELQLDEEGLFIAHTNAEVARLPFKATWQFENGTVRRGLSVRHAFDRTGTHVATFTLAGTDRSVTDSLRVRVVAPEHPR